MSFTGQGRVTNVPCSECGLDTWHLGAKCMECGTEVARLDKLEAQRSTRNFQINKRQHFVDAVKG